MPVCVPAIPTEPAGRARAACRAAAPQSARSTDPRYAKAGQEPEHEHAIRRRRVQPNDFCLASSRAKAATAAKVGPELAAVADGNLDGRATPRVDGGRSGKPAAARHASASSSVAQRIEVHRHALKGRHDVADAGERRTPRAPRPARCARIDAGSIAPRTRRRGRVARRRRSRTGSSPSACRSFWWMPPKPPFDMSTTRSPSLCSLHDRRRRCRRSTASRAAGPRSADRAPAAAPTGARLRAASIGRPARSGLRQRGPKARAKSSWNTRRHDEAERGSKTAQIRRSDSTRAGPRASRRPRSDDARSRRTP